MKTKKQDREEPLNTAKEVSGAEFLNVGGHVRSDVLRLRDGSGYLMTWQLDGIPFEATEDEYLESRSRALVSFIKSIGGGERAVWVHRVRRLTVPDFGDAEYDNAFAAQVDAKYRDRLSKSSMMETALFMTLLVRCPSFKIPKWQFWVPRKGLEDIAQKEAHYIAEIHGQALQVEAALKRYGPRRLGIAERNGRKYSELAELFSYLMTGVQRQVPYTQMDVRHQLQAGRVFFGDRNGLWEAKGNPATYGRFYDILQYPEAGVTVRTNDAILAGDFEFIETQSYSLMARRDAAYELEKQRKQMIAGDEASTAEIDSMAEAIESLRDGRIEMGEYHYSLNVLGRSLEEAEAAAKRAEALMSEQDFLLVPNVECPDAAWLAQIPGSWALRPRLAYIPSPNFACMSALHNYPAGKRDGNPWGRALTVLDSVSRQPYYFNLHRSPQDEDSEDRKLPGNTVVLGATGVGKTTFVLFLVCQLQKYRPHLVVFDKDRGTEIAIRALGGSYTAFKRGEYTGLNPFQWRDTPATRKLCESLVEVCVGGNLSARERDDIHRAVKVVFEEVDFDQRRLAAVDQALPDVGENGLGLRLARWVNHGALAWVLDSPRDTLQLDSNRLFGFDYTEFLDDNETRTPIMMALLAACEGLIDGTPFAYVMDEFWKPLSDPVFTEFAKDKLKTIRKQNGLGLFSTQSPSDALQSSIGKTIVEQCITHIYLPNPKASYDDYVGGFKCTPAEFELIRNFGEDSRLMLVKQGEGSTVCRLDLGGMQEELVALSGSTDNVLRLDEIRAQVGDDFAAWWPLLTGKK
nr:hypothetical protein [uncultured Pseudogulbenkiania sp.]